MVSKHSTAHVPVIGIDCLRLIAAVMVMTFHFGFRAFNDADGLLATMSSIAPGLPASWMFTWWGWVGVQIFFLISGLVIAFSAQSSVGNPRRFLRSRVLRLVPVVLIASCFALAVEIAFFRTPAEDAFSNFVRTIAFWPYPPWIMGQFWTLGIEIGFYLLVLLVIACGYVRMLPQIAAALIVVSLAYWCLRYTGGGRLGRISALILLQHGAYFGMGILLAERVRSQPKRWHLVFLALGLLVAAMQIQVAAEFEVGTSGLAGYWIWPFLVFVTCFGASILALRYNDVIVRKIGLSNAQVFRTMGMMTFPLYLIHNHVGKPILVWALDLGIPSVASVVLAMGVALAASWWIAVNLEPKVYRWVAKAYDWMSDRLQIAGIANRQ